jgi:hypothetical protein
MVKIKYVHSNKCLKKAYDKPKNNVGAIKHQTRKMAK